MVIGSNPCRVTLRAAEIGWVRTRTWSRRTLEKVFIGKMKQQREDEHITASVFGDNPQVDEQEVEEVEEVEEVAKSRQKDSLGSEPKQVRLRKQNS